MNSGALSNRDSSSYQETKDEIYISKLLNSELLNFLVRVAWKRLKIGVVQKTMICDIRIQSMNIDIFVNPPLDLIENIFKGDMDLLPRVILFLQRSDTKYAELRNRMLREFKRKVQLIPYDTENNLRKMLVELLRSSERRAKVQEFVQDGHAEINYTFLDQCLGNIVGENVIEYLRYKNISAQSFVQCIKEQDPVIKFDLGNYFPFVYEKLFGVQSNDGMEE